MDNFRFTKAKFLLKITEVEKVEVDGKEQLNIVGSKLEWCRGSDLERSLKEDYKNNVARKIEFCNGKPDTFAVGVLYIRKDGKEAYVFKEKEN
jgi:hypothetical protein